MNKIIVFYDKSFPYEGARPNGEQLAALAEFAASRCGRISGCASRRK